MASGVKARSEYGGLLLTCDEDAFARIRGHILAEPSVAEAISNADDGLDVQFISVRMPPVESTSRGPSWFSRLPTIIACGLSGTAFIVGYVTIIRWFVRLIA